MIVPLRHKENTHSSRENLVTFTDIEMRIRKKNLTSALSSQGNHVMVEYVEREAHSRVTIEVRPEEVVPSLKEIPSMVQLEAPQLREFVVLIFGDECRIYGDRHNDGGYTNGTNDRIFFRGDGA